MAVHEYDMSVVGEGWHGWVVTVGEGYYGHGRLLSRMYGTLAQAEKPFHGVGVQEQHQRRDHVKAEQVDVQK
uniref:Uncharacterized protein n=1 Tax=Ralstonia solanacearum CFBP2957 TaxID=859656 RepID=D8P279_RALSL|nr:protein of unknown function [Ralstonia solanacearum CFBP2957]